MSDQVLFPLRAGDEFIELYKLLKAEGLTESGGEAKHVIGEGRVLVNGEVETHKRKKLVEGDTVQFQGVNLRVVTEQ
ncbi:MAG: RNA-binding S4 domain-containing protein [Shewanella sp.]|nr:RNA-binding S4 domain-containing protein [Shewanella sp.]MCF1429608.1 RNA-binding S4 domain-containing protein [Shewanella sp.]MCF1437999.1 RNA-binding S4 domain-containing protein [Shewanella sp.]MCF1458387.1 RNA-binding S4 domain-containing protein [Shewanella sp.]